MAYKWLYGCGIFAEFCHELEFWLEKQIAVVIIIFNKLTNNFFMPQLQIIANFADSSWDMGTDKEIINIQVVKDFE